MKVSFRFIAKIGLLLVVLGFFMPVVAILGNRNGFRLAQNMLDLDKTLSAVCLYIVFCAAAVGSIIGALLIMKKKIKIHYDWLCVLASIGGGLIVYFSDLERIRVRNLEIGAYLILAGWIIALVAQVLSIGKKRA